MLKTCLIRNGAPGAIRTLNLLIRSQYINVSIVSTQCYFVHYVHKKWK